MRSKSVSKASIVASVARWVHFIASRMAVRFQAEGEGVLQVGLFLAGRLGEWSRTEGCPHLRAVVRHEGTPVAASLAARAA